LFGADLLDACPLVGLSGVPGTVLLEGDVIVVVIIFVNPVIVVGFGD